MDENGKKKRGMYKMLVQMIKQLGLSVVSEGLDDEKHLAATQKDVAVITLNQVT